MTGATVILSCSPRLHKVTEAGANFWDFGNCDVRCCFDFEVRMTAEWSAAGGHRPNDVVSKSIDRKCRCPSSYNPHDDQLSARTL